jgi:hypothetical protein
VPYITLCQENPRGRPEFESYRQPSKVNIPRCLVFFKSEVRNAQVTQSFVEFELVVQGSDEVNTLGVVFDSTSAIPLIRKGVGKRPVRQRLDPFVPVL